MATTIEKIATGRHAAVVLQGVTIGEAIEWALVIRREWEQQRCGPNPFLKQVPKYRSADGTLQVLVPTEGGNLALIKQAFESQTPVSLQLYVDKVRGTVYELNAFIDQFEVRPNSPTLTDVAFEGSGPVTFTP